VAACGTNQAHRPGLSRGSSPATPSSYDSPGPPHDPWGPYIQQASRRFDVPQTWIREVMRQESAGRVTATSPVGAMGLMQVMPQTYAELRGRYGDLGDDPYHPWNSIMAGTAYIREMYDLFGAPAFLAAYNAGPRRLEDYLWGSRGLPNETRNYVARIGPRIEGTHPTRRAMPEVYAAAEIPLNIPAGPRRMDRATMLALREQRESASPPVQVAQLPPGPVTRMETVDSAPASSYSPPVQVASLASGTVVRMDPIPDGSTYGSTYGLSGTVIGMDPIPNPPEEPPAPATRSAIGASPRVAPPAPRGRAAGPVQTAARAAPAGRDGRVQVAARVEPARPAASPFATAAAAPRSGFSLIPSAQAGTLPNPPRGGGSGPANWGVQVGAFSSENLARATAGQAREQIASLGSRTVVQPVEAGGSRLYRARVTGLSESQARAACARTRAACTVLSPGAAN